MVSVTLLNTLQENAQIMAAEDNMYVHGHKTDTCKHTALIFKWTGSKSKHGRSLSLSATANSSEQLQQESCHGREERPTRRCLTYRAASCCQKSSADAPTLPLATYLCLRQNEACNPPGWNTKPPKSQPTWIQHCITQSPAKDSASAWRIYLQL